MAETVEPRWRRLLDGSGPEMREGHAGSALRMISGVTELHQPYFFVVLGKRPTAPQMSSAITVEVAQRAIDGSWTLTLRLVDRALMDAFVSLLSDIAERSAGEPTEADAWKTFVGSLFDL